jgi:hypothetical protein
MFKMSVKYDITSNKLCWLGYLFEIKIKSLITIYFLYLPTNIGVMYVGAKAPIEIIMRGLGIH